ncbi:hypothetical protein KAX06_03260 [candidate division WOR-3 bacterium]|nr:hypothetical protein [candidate division WOR-3 bacterium]
MNKGKRGNREYSSFEEYKRVFFPNTSSKESIMECDPKEFATKLATESLEKHKELLPQE